MTERLVEQARRGDSAAFVALIEERQAAMTRVAMAILGNRTDAEDALQDGLTALWRQLPRLRDSSRFDACWCCAGVGGGASARFLPRPGPRPKWRLRLPTRPRSRTRLSIATPSAGPSRPSPETLAR